VKSTNNIIPSKSTRTTHAYPYPHPYIFVDPQISVHDNSSTQRYENKTILISYCNEDTYCADAKVCNNTNAYGKQFTTTK